ncbi:hypothetical protein ACFXO2_16930 [Streptomyces sp. NPDC059152]|uniref:hypothetical protein n=1 Tax=Streptomyces sp. NPDC059152 TaxID=3346742 RepID=UPI0036C27DBF
MPYPGPPSPVEAFRTTARPARGSRDRIAMLTDASSSTGCEQEEEMAKAQLND